MVSDKEIEAARAVLEHHIYDEGGCEVERVPAMVREMLEAAARVRAEADAMEPVADEKLPCDVQLPGVKLKRGVRLSTLLMAIRKRKDWPEEQTKLPRMAVNPAPQPSGTVKALADALRGLLKAYENAFDWTAELPPETAEAERIANEVLEALTSPTPPTAGGGE